MTDDEAEYLRRCAKVEKAFAKLYPTEKRPQKSSWFEQQSTIKLPPIDIAAQMSPELRAVLRRKWHIMGSKWRTEAAE